MKNRSNLNGWGGFAVMATALVSFLSLPASAAFVPAAVETTGASVTTTVLPDQSTVVKFLANGSFTVPDGATGRLLVVAGGGGAGYDCSGGGGGGGVIETNDVVLAAGTYTVTVGAGGAHRASSGGPGSNGGNTVLSFGGSDLLVAFGGGGGGSWSVLPGQDGGCGGGAAQGGTPGKGVPGQGFDATQGSGPGAGGGAGGSPLAGTVGRGNGGGQQAQGGPGRTNDITGTLEVYGPGGGAGGDNGRGGLGGDAEPDADGWRWGCGRTHSNYENDAAMAEAKKSPNGRAGYGGGGGGASNSNYNGGDGGSGVLIVRLDPVPVGPNPKMNVLGVTDGPESAAVRARIVTVGDEASSVAVSYAVATSAAALDSATPVEVATGAVAGDTVSFTIPGLTAGTTYYVRVLAENNLGETGQTDDAECLPYVSLVPLTAANAARVFDVGQDRVAVFNQSSDTMTFTLAERAAVELLLVGGGGAGGGYIGGGGGAGGFLHVETAVLDAGTYTVSVGAGGAPTATDQRPGGNGGETTLAKYGEAQNLYVAHGGGGGGGYASGYRNGAAGGSGGGAGIQAGVAGASTAADGERGNPGGANDSSHTGWNIGSGGGGAGAPGTHADYTAGVGGKGGDGLPCSITGEEVWYAGGGGAGQNDQAQGGFVVTPGLGGRGGGGMGCRTADAVVDDYECGVDGLGGGGGGGRRESTNAAGSPRRGAPGGSGTLIVRWRATPAATARATVDSVVGSVGGAIVAGSIQLAGADASGATLEMAVGPTGGSLGSYETLGTGLGAGERFTLTLTGLAAGTDFDYAIRVRSGEAAGEVLGAATGSFSTFATAPARLSGDPTGAVKTMVGTDSVYTFATNATYTFTVASRGRARLLMVGGGGAGGSRRGGGGGAGGFIELPAVTLEPGTYTVVVGAGGTPSATQGVGGDGTDSVLSLGNTVLYTAHGGGGGGYGNRDAGTVNSRGHAGGSGGGGGPCAPVGGASTAVAPELGNPGGKGSGQAADKFDSAAAGGGGAGGPGSDGYWSNVSSGPERRQGGNGGPGVASDITGATLYYAGGGGGSVWYDTYGGYKGLGGSGVGGDGGGYTTEVCLNVTTPTPGLDGTGSGGGGGPNFNNSNDAQNMGAKGGCGAFILRLAANDSADRPEVVIESLSAGATSVDAVLALRNSGSAATADLSLVYGPAEDTLDLSTPVAAGAARGLYSATVAGLAPGRTWFFAPVASNAGGAVTGAVQSVTLPAAGALPAGDGAYGLWQAARAATAATFSDVFTNTAFWATVSSSNVVAGALAADTRDILFADPVSGGTYVWGNAPAIYAYRGWIYLSGGKTVVFGSRYADSVYVAVDGRTLISVCKSDKTESFGSITTDEAGWHEIDVRVGHHTGSFGPDGNGTASWQNFGVAFNENGCTSPMPESGWTRILDDGSGALLRPSRPEARTLTLASQSVAGGTLSLGAVVGSGENAAHAYLVYGAEDLGTLGTLGTLEALGALESLGWTVSDLGAVAASAEAANLAAQVAGWGSAAQVARLVLETEGALAWTEPVTYASTTLPSVGDVVVSDYALGDRATIAAAVSGGTAPYAVTLLLGADASSLAAVATTTLAEAGGFAFSLADLAAGAQHYFQIVATDDNGATARSEVLSFVTPGASRIFDFKDGSDATSWNSANPFENRQRTIVFGGTLSEYGAGETTVRLLRNQTWYGAPSAFPGATTTVPHEGESLVLPAAGTYSLSLQLDWDLDLSWNWDVSNATATASWGPTAELRDGHNYARNTTIIDATKYTWKGGEGLWTDAASWTPDGVWTEIAGYPRRGSYAVFPANGTAVVSVPETSLTNRFTQLQLLAGADVTFRPAPGATDATLRLQGESAASSARGYSFDIRKNVKLRFEGEGLFADFFGSWGALPNDTDTSLTFADGVRARIGYGSGNNAWTANNKARSLFCVTNGAEVTILGQLVVNGDASQIVIDDAKVLQVYAANDSSGVFLRGKNMNGLASLVIRGTNAVLQVGRRFRTQSTDTADKTQYIDFEVPEGGWIDAPIRSNPANTYKFGADGTSNYKIVLRVPETSPAVVAGESLDVPLVRWPSGINETYVTLAPANLPHPATDSFFQTTDPATGQVTVWAHLVGQADTAAPQASDFRVRALAQTGADLSFVVIPGSGSSTAVSATVLDANGDAVAGATVSPASATFSAAGTNLVSVAGLDPATDYTLHVTLDDGTNPAVTADFPFSTLDDWGEGESATADAVAQDGPYTVWTFTDTTPHAATFTVTRGGLAELLVVGGGGGGAAGHSGNEYGGGGGGGGQVIATNLVLVPGTYSIQVGAGGALSSTSSRGIGSTGGKSSFGDLVAVGGGGGGYNTTLPLAGASGGGGSNAKAGAAATAGFAGGAGVSKGGGGGGGGASGAGAAGSGMFGGAGGTGVTNAISGHPAVYGAGGGGGSGGSYSVYKGAGAAGADTAGNGGMRSVDGRTPEAVAAMSGTPGFGGGGGGGCASSDGVDTSAGSPYGGAGGSGVVIVRMRTATAADPAPQASIKEETADEADWTASLWVYTLGEGASDVSATLRVARDGAAETNAFPMGTIDATGAATLVATGLAPSSDYAGVLVLDNGQTGGALEIPVAFTTADPAATTVSASSAWTFGQWTSAAADFHAANLLLLPGTPPAATVASTGATATEANPVRTANGADDYFELYPDRRYEWTWDDPVYLTAFRVFYNSSDYRSGVNVWSVEALGEDGTWTVISPTTGHYNAKWGRNYGYLLPADGADFLWDKPARGLRFTSDAFTTTSYCNFREAEAEGVPVADMPAELSVSTLSRTAAGVKALVAFSHALPADATVYACVAATHGGTDASAWTAVTNATATAGALSQNVSIGAAALAGMNYLRFYSDDGNGGVRWSETVYLPDVEVLASIPPTVLFVAVRGTTPSTATLSAGLVDAGSGAENDRANLSVRCAAQSNDVATAAARLVAGDIPEGETTAVLSGLMPGRLYWAQFVASNAGGDTGASEIFSFTTAPDEIGGGAESASTVWVCDTWTTATASTTNNLLRGLLGTETAGDLASAGALVYLTDGRIDENNKFWGPGPGTSVEFELGGTFSLSEFRLYQYSGDATQRKVSIASLEWRDEAGAWHRIPGTQLEFDANNNNNCAFLRPADGSPYLAVGATAFRYVQGEGGGLPKTHSMREMELLGEPSGGYRVLTVEAASWSAGTLTATVARPLTNAVGTIHAVSGAAYHGTDAAAWAADGSDAVFGTLAADETTVSDGTFVPAAGAVYIRFYEADGDGNVVAWSDTIPADPAAVRIVDAGVEADGDTAVFPARIVSAGTGTLSAALLLATDPDFTDATNIVVANPGVGAFSVEADVDPGATYWYRWVAETTDGGYDETPAASFTTRAGSVLVSALAVSGVTHRYATLNGALDTLGAGTTTLEILIGDSANSLEVYDTVVLDSQGAFSIQELFTGAPRTIYVRLHAINVAPGGTTWESWSTTASFTTTDTVTYTWKKSVHEGAWNNPSNWTPNVSYYCTGYPDHANAITVFENGTIATVTVPGKYRYGTWNVYRSDLDVTFVGEGPDVSGLGSNNDNMGGGLFRNCNWTFSGVSLAEKDGINFGDTSSWNSTLRFTDGTVASFGNNVTGIGSNMWIVVDNGATLSFRAGGPRMGMKFGGLVVDNGTVSAPILWTDYNWNQTTNQAVLVSGTAPRIELATSFRNESTAAASLQNADTAFLFSVPSQGWAEPAIYSENEGEKFAGLLGDAAGGYVIAIDPESRAIIHSGRSRTVPLVAWKGGIDTSHVTLPAPTGNATVYYTYGWPSVLTEPENAGDAPTGIRATLVGKGGTMLLIK